ncbi:MAG: hypothetical protein ACTHLR_03125 [Rhizomicrobium sp.]
MRSKSLIAYVTSLAIMSATAPAFAGGSYGGGHMNYGGMNGGPGCKNMGGHGGITINKPTYINKNVNVFKPVNINKNINYNNNININKNINANKNVNFNNNININKNINVNNNVNINKNVNDNKNISINKNIVIVKNGGGNAEAAAFAAALAQAQSSSQANVNVSSGSYSESVSINQGGGYVGGAIAVQAQQTCHMTEASVVKAIHAVCIAEGHEFPASHMTRDTWIDSAYEGEVARCIPGARLKVTIGDMVQSDQGMAGAYDNGTVLDCAMGEALRHYKDGMLKCAPAVPVKDCTERTNLRLFGTGDFFFSFRTQVCATSARSAETESSNDVSGMALDGGVGINSQY